MIAALRCVRSTGVVVFAAVLCVFATRLAAQGPARYEGRPLAEALRSLQSSGLPIVFSSEVVTSGMRVKSEPRGGTPREVLDAMLKPHDLVAEDGPGGIVQVIRMSTPSQPPPRRHRPARTKTAGSSDSDRPAYSERVMVRAPDTAGLDGVAGSSIVLRGEQLQQMRSVLADDPVRAVHALPRVAAGDDFRSEFSVRGSPYRHVAIVTDGIATPWLQHSAYGRTSAGSVAMVSTDVVGETALHAGAYPQRYGDQLGAQLSLTLSEGSRTDTRLRGALGGASASLLGEGPLGRSERGSWLVAIRNSYRDWPVRRRNSADPAVFGFSDLQSKFVYDVSSREQLSVSVLAGRSVVDGADDPGPVDLADGRHRSGAVQVAWRSTIGRGVLIQQAHLVGQEYLHKRRSGQDAVRGGDVDASYRVTVMHDVFGGLLEAGGQIERTRSSLRVPFSVGRLPQAGETVALSTGTWIGSAWRRAGYANYSWQPHANVTITSGIRLSGSTAAAQPVVGRWLLGEWRVGSGWTVNASTGVSHQLPDLHFIADVTGHDRLRAEQASHVDAGIGRRLSSGVRWQATLYDRRERDVLRPRVEVIPREEWVAMDPRMLGEHENALTGNSRGVELLLERGGPARLSGWLSYSFGTSRQTDTERQETFWSDFDQRHSLNLFGHYAVSDRTNIALTFRSTTNFPIPGYVTSRDGRLYAFTVRNTARLPRYARLDARIERRFRTGDFPLTAFGEVVNVLNRRNLGLARGFVRPESGEAVGFTEPLFPRLVSAGLRVDF